MRLEGLETKMAKKSGQTEQVKTPFYKRKWFIFLLAFLLLGGCVRNCTNSTGDNKEQVEPVVEVEDTASPEDNKDESEKDSVASEKDEPTLESEGEPAKAALTIDLVAGQENEYSKSRTWNAGTEFEETQLVYYVPAGTYEVTNAGEYPTQVNVYEGVAVTDEGWEEPANVGDIITLKVGETGQITVPEGYYIEIAEPTHVVLEMK
jgi:hypothetical protein